MFFDFFVQKGTRACPIPILDPGEWESEWRRVHFDPAITFYMFFSSFAPPPMRIADFLDGFRPLAQWNDQLLGPGRIIRVVRLPDPSVLHARS